MLVIGKRMPRLVASFSVNIITSALCLCHSARRYVVAA